MNIRLKMLSANSKTISKTLGGWTLIVVGAGLGIASLYMALLTATSDMLQGAPMWPLICILLVTLSMAAGFASFGNYVLCNRHSSKTFGQLSSEFLRSPLR